MYDTVFAHATNCFYLATMRQTFVYKKFFQTLLWGARKSKMMHELHFLKIINSIIVKNALCMHYFLYRIEVY